MGSGTDAIDKRGYVPGDDVRRIDWSAYARFERLLVRVVADEEPTRLGLLVDTSGSMAFGAPSKLTQASRLAAGLAAVAVGSEDRVALVATSPRPRVVSRSAGGRAGLQALLRALVQLAPEGPTDLVAAARAMRGALGGRGVCVVLSDLWDPSGTLAGARALRDLGHEVVLARVLSAFERDPAGLDGATLEDEETGELLELPPAGVRDAYRAAFDEHARALAEGADALGAPLIDVDAAEPFDAVVTRALERGLLSARGLV